MLNASKELLEGFVQGKFKQLNCPQCENTFLTNVYEVQCLDLGSQKAVKCAEVKPAFPADGLHSKWSPYVILEKFALGLEYFQDAIISYELKQVPYMRRLGVLDEHNNVLDPATIQLFKPEEPEYRILYLMERLEHLGEEDAEFFNEYVYGMDWKDKSVRQEIVQWIGQRYGEPLAEDIRKLCLYFRAHEEFLAWDLHGDNLMRRIRDGQIVVMDPYAVKIA